MRVGLPFATGAKGANWKEKNCDKCAKNYSHDEKKYRCKWEQEIDLAWRTNGLISIQCARAIGHSGAGGFYTWDCPSLVNPGDPSTKGRGAVPGQKNLFMEGKMEKPKTQESGLMVRANDALEYVREMAVKNQEDLSAANKVLVRIGQVKKEIVAYWDDPITTAHKAHRALLKKKKDMLEPLEQADGILKPRVRDYMEAERRKREAAEREAAIKEAAEKKKADEAMAEAAKLEQEGEIDAALDKLDEAAKIEDTREKAIIPESPVTEGMHTRRTWKYRVLNEAQIPRDCLSEDSKKINAKIKAGVREIPGLQIYEDVSVVART